MPSERIYLWHMHVSGLLLGGVVFATVIILPILFDVSNSFCLSDVVGCNASVRDILSSHGCMQLPWTRHFYSVYDALNWYLV